MTSSLAKMVPDLLLFSQKESYYGSTGKCMVISRDWAIVRQCWHEKLVSAHIGKQNRECCILIGAMHGFSVTCDHIAELWACGPWLLIWIQNRLNWLWLSSSDHN
jgi:hypothetical protein